MKKSEIKALISGVSPMRELCRVYFKYDRNYRYCFPISVGERLFLAANEDDFIIDGFTVRRFADVKKVGIKNDKCIEIIKSEGILDKIEIPHIDVTDWHGVFDSLSKLGRNIIVERESLAEDESEFAVGKIIKVLKTKVLFKHFDSDGIWQDEYYEIPYSQITSVTFSSRYVEVFSKYV
ncbi:MAG: hypothetical protein IKV40_07805 [Clostridia bacterium]|nr:hypothetical protein [Clostridia bacterium]MBR5448309.1 hypothetical protein [Clostridia bacterium]